MCTSLNALRRERLRVKEVCNVYPPFPKHTAGVSWDEAERAFVALCTCGWSLTVREEWYRDIPKLDPKSVAERLLEEHLRRSNLPGTKEAQ